MNHTDYTSLTAMITAIKAQISSLETILASIANQKVKKKENVRASSVDDDDYLLSDDQEKQLEEYMEAARQQEVARMQKQAEKYFQKEMDSIAVEENHEPS